MDRRSFLRASTVGGAAAAATSLAAPAIAQGRTTCVIVSTWPRGFPGLGTGAERVAARITELTDGAVTTEYYAAGERVGAFDAFDAVSAGDAQAYHGADYYWKGKHPAWSYVTAVPFGLVAAEQNAFFKYLGGRELWDELGDEFGIKGFHAGNTGVQMGGWFNKEMNSPEDFRGLRMRIPGIGGDMMANMGVSVVSLPGGQIYENLVSGAIDATEWVGPWNDYFLNLYQAARYYYWPGVHEPGAALSMGFNKSWLTSLPSWQQAAIEAACGEENDRMLAEFNANNGTYLARLVNEHGVQLREFNDDIYDAFGVASDQTFEAIRAHSDLANRMHEAFLAARENAGGWMNISDVPYLRQRNRVLGID
ncbi:MAG: TRAP transporter substrate-binding protein [Rhodobacter sp.]|uniref:TRAP transporter substrate-binding protein n=1 Tax=Pararhodobacter sp. TaxID=2127056 RepID=UPI001D94A93B|nr:TRAP transporter substrate-binding protein [Pararhodobacter sp.]MCB1345894.1 TRAP transporter substrate-binding protein [Paracoccaceae bacterium]MCC0072780.1 TRAP transporter substrate-binding protein [Rhodobacter sp.]HPD92080.1 TRAP transporter substrate-binding protein [Pararhodobacter sp.]